MFKLPFVSRKKYDEVVYKLECLLCHATGEWYSKADYPLDCMYQMVDEYIYRCMDIGRCMEAQKGTPNEHD